MGHYRSEMMCNKCGDVRCSCPPKKEDVEGEMWVVDALYNIMTGAEFRKTHNTGFSYYNYLRMQKFAIREEAVTHALKSIEDQITEHVKQIENLHTIRKNLK